MPPSYLLRYNPDRLPSIARLRGRRVNSFEMATKYSSNQKESFVTLGYDNSNSNLYACMYGIKEIKKKSWIDIGL